MVYLRCVFVRTSVWTYLAVLVVCLDWEVGAGTMKFTYKKPIFGNLDTIKEKRFNLRPSLIRNTPLASLTNLGTNINAGKNINTSLKMGTTTNAKVNTPSGEAISAISNTNLVAGGTNMNATISPTMSITTPTTLSTTMPTQIAPTEEPSLDEPITISLPTESYRSVYKAEPVANHHFESAEPEHTFNIKEIEKLLSSTLMTDDDDALREYLVLNGVIERSSAPDVTDDSVPEVEPLANNRLEEEHKGPHQQLLSEIFTDADTRQRQQSAKAVENEEEIEELFPLPEPEPLIAPRLLATPPTKVGSNMIHTAAKTTTTTEKPRPVPCTCGVFLTSQFRRGSNDQPRGAPVITNELDRTYACNAMGQKQCQTKCLGNMVQHLPNSANILCATLNRDCHKERAYLFIKNCRDHWVNTNLAAGREYCCRDGQPYNCPLV